MEKMILEQLINMSRQIGEIGARMDEGFRRQDEKMEKEFKEQNQKMTEMENRLSNRISELSQDSAQIFNDVFREIEKVEKISSKKSAKVI